MLAMASSRPALALNLRNRIAHHEAIFFSDLRNRHVEILRLARTIDPEAARYVAGLSRIEDLLDEMPAT